MPAHRLPAWFFVTASVVSMLACIWFALWFITAASLASGYCGDTFSLFASEFRCRQPHLAMVGASVTFGLTLLFAIRSWRAAHARAAA
jgi:hypothetical protein